jgi:ABC-type multidrug transport system ATPase subunit
MEIRLEGIGKRFQSDWIFRNMTATIGACERWGVLGRNGSGKSTLLRILNGNISPTHGTILWSHDGTIIPASDVFRYLALVAPYQELIEEFTLHEMITFHFSFKKMEEGYTVDRIIELLGFGDTYKKPIRQFSSGMKQRVKLALAFMSDVPLLLLDEPTTNLDTSGIDWYYRLIRDLSRNRTLVICSNMHQTEAGFVEKTLMIEDFKDRR